MAASAVLAAAGRAAGCTSARQRQHVSPSAWLIAPHVGQMASCMLIHVVSAVREQKLSPERGIPPMFRAR